MLFWASSAGKSTYWHAHYISCRYPDAIYFTFSLILVHGSESIFVLFSCVTNTNLAPMHNPVVSRFGAFVHVMRCDVIVPVRPNFDKLWCMHTISFWSLDGRHTHQPSNFHFSFCPWDVGGGGKMHVDARGGRGTTYSVTRFGLNSFSTSNLTFFYQTSRS